MTKTEMEKELGELIYRFKVLKKALVEDDNALSPAHQRAVEIAASLKRLTDPPIASSKLLTREQVLAKAREMLEQQHSQRLANQLQKSGILGTRPLPRQPSDADMVAQAVANGGDTEESLAKANADWGNTFKSFFAEATKPLNQRFKSEAEELEYWSKIQVRGSGRDEGSGY